MAPKHTSSCDAPSSGWHSQRSAFVKQVFFTMHADSALDEDQLLEKLFDDGNYSFLKETTRVFDAVLGACG